MIVSGALRHWVSLKNPAVRASQEAAVNNSLLMALDAYGGLLGGGVSDSEFRDDRIPCLEAHTGITLPSCPNGGWWRSCAVSAGVAAHMAKLLRLYLAGEPPRRAVEFSWRLGFGPCALVLDPVALAVSMHSAEPHVRHQLAGQFFEVASLGPFRIE